MKALTLCSIALIVFAAAPVFACGDGGDKDKTDTAAFTIDVQTLCGGDKGDKPKPEPDPEPTCGGDKGDKPAPEPQLLCGDTCGGDKDKDETKA